MSLTTRQQRQVNRQVKAYEKQAKVGNDHLVLTVGGSRLDLTIMPYVANPKIMNSGLQVVRFLKGRPELVEGRRVLDMGTGCGIIGLVASLLGAETVYLADIDKAAVDCANLNIESNVVGRCVALQSDLFKVFSPARKFDVQIFNHPFFFDEPLLDKEWTRMMLDNGSLLESYLSLAPRYSQSDAAYIMPWFPAAGRPRRGMDNNPGRYAKDFGYEVLEAVEMPAVEQGVQKEPFIIYIMCYVG